MADIVTSRIFVDGEKGITAAKLNDIVASSVIQPAFYTSKPTASTVNPADIALILQSGAYAQTPISALGGAATQAQIWSTRLRSYNSLSNPNFEVDQRTTGSGMVFGSGAASGFALDRWYFSKAGSMTGSAQSVIAAIPILVPGTNFNITRSLFRIIVATQQTSLGGADYCNFEQYVEGPDWRELQNDVHSISLLVRSSVAGLNFGVTLRDHTPTKTLAKLCTIPAANTWTLVTLPSLPLWASGNFTTVPGVVGYRLGICLAAGASQIVPANDTWQTINAIGAVGQNNFFASPTNSTFDIAFIQHEPGVVCSTLMDKPFIQNYDQCLRYYQKSYDYDVLVGTGGALGAIALQQVTTSTVLGSPRFHKPMAKVPTMISYVPTTGVANGILIASTPYAVTGFNGVGKAGFLGVNGTSLPAVVAGAFAQLHYTADTGL